jgi:cyclophilin family peptidyl-prolyl cis-trans isomerase
MDDPRRRRLTIVGAAAVAVVVLLVLALALGGGDDDGGDGDGGNPVAATGFTYGTGECPPDERPDEPVVRFDAAPRRCIEDGGDYAAVLTTDLGEVTIDLDEQRAPGTVNNFVTLARHGYYDGTTFHRVIPTFVAQGGDAVGDPPGTGDIGYTIPDELPGAGEYEVGSVAMANRFQATTGQGTDTGSSQFFIITGPAGAALPPHYSLFGRVTDGMDVVTGIEERGSSTGDPVEVVTITTVEIVER